MSKQSKLNYSLKLQILQLYKKGMSCAEIKELIDVPVTQRTVERLVHNSGLTRTANV